MAHIITIGEILVEVMATNVGQRFDQIGAFTGPFPSGAPAIFVDQAAKCGSSSLIVSAVGDDGFGIINLNRLRTSGVDISRVRVVANIATGVAFVTYREDGSRDFIYHIANAAYGRIDADFVEEADFRDCNYFHIMGTSLGSEGVERAIAKGIAYANHYGSMITFDPNVRKELLKDEKARKRLIDILHASQIIFVGEHELSYLTGVAEELDIVKALLHAHATMIIVKRGSRGATLYMRENTFDVAAYPVVEVDPTGAGDCFAGTFIACLDQGIVPHESLRLAAIAGAMAVTKQGPMEGNTRLGDLRGRYEMTRQYDSSTPSLPS